MAEYSNLPKPAELSLAGNWCKWKQNMKFYLDEIPSTIPEKQKCSAFLLLTGKKRTRDFQHLDMAEKEGKMVNPLMNTTSLLKDYLKNVKIVASQNET